MGAIANNVRRYDHVQSRFVVPIQDSGYDTLYAFLPETIYNFGSINSNRCCDVEGLLDAVSGAGRYKIKSSFSTSSRVPSTLKLACCIYWADERVWRLLTSA